MVLNNEANSAGHNQKGEQVADLEGKIVQSWEKKGEKCRRKRQRSGRFFHFVPTDRKSWLHACK